MRAAYFMVNCAHPTHFLTVLDGPGAVAPHPRHPRERVDDEPRRARRTPRSSTTAIPADLARGYLAIGERLPHLTVLGGCCGTDHRHVASIADAWFGGALPPEGSPARLRGDQVGDAHLLGEQRAEARRVAADVRLAEILPAE